MIGLNAACWPNPGGTIRIAIQGPMYCNISRYCIHADVLWFVLLKNCQCKRTFFMESDKWPLYWKVHVTSSIKDNLSKGINIVLYEQKINKTKQNKTKKPVSELIRKSKDNSSNWFPSLFCIVLWRVMLIKGQRDWVQLSPAHLRGENSSSLSLSINFAIMWSFIFPS